MVYHHCIGKDNRTYYCGYRAGLTKASHFSIITESEGRQSVVKSDEICADSFAPIVSIPLLDCQAKFLSDSKNYPNRRPSVTCQTTADYL